MAVAWVLLTLLVGGLLVAHRSGRAGAEWVLKPLASLTFVGAAALGRALESAAGTVFFAGLVLAAAGDVLLIPKSKASFLGGLVAFLLGHVAYAIGFLVLGVDVGWAAWAAPWMVVSAALVLAWLNPRVEARMQRPVLAYVIVISVMVALAIGAARHTGRPVLAVFAILFYLSDLTVARERFVKKDFANRAVGLPLYFYAQLLLATSI
ncbi:MAG: lysoplasmalogenase [Polyangiaceae bacterium]